MEKSDHVLSPLSKTWIFDLDGTLVKHNGYLKDGKDSLLDGTKELITSIPKDDLIIIITSRKEEYRSMTESFLKENNIRYDFIIWGAPFGERILFNDRKLSGLATAIAINKDRDAPVEFNYIIDENL